ncbi:MAG TPA: acyloxyacyl hydrolase [Bacteroidales bacterium]|nr:acyloxyacyl hydrolase [Bacteroidales bacterium]
MKLLIVLFLLATSRLLIAQSDNSNDLFIGGKLHYGFIFAPEEIKPLPLTRPYGFELNLSKLYTSYESWKIFRSYNIAGIQAAYYNYQNPGVIGSSYVISAYTEPIIRNRRLTVISMRAGGGLSYQTKIYNPVTDSLNRFVSARVSFIFYLSARFKYKLSPNTLLTLSGNFNHISNGAIRIPNMGLNFPTFSLGLEYFPKRFPALNHGYRFVEEAGTSGSYIVLEALGGFRYVYGQAAGIYGASARFTRQFNSWFALHGGAELVMDGGVRKTIVAENGNADYKRFALTAGFDFIAGKFTATQYLGLYLYSPWKAKDPVYQKFELTYKIFPDIRTGIALKTYIGEVDFVGWTLNYLLRLK